MPSGRVIVVGAGIGGLSAALALAARGVEVVVLEAALQPGGKMRQVQIGDAWLDAGPTVFTMRWVFEELFAQVGESLDQHLRLQPVTTLARHAWSADERLDLFADPARAADAIGAFAGPAEAARYLAFCQRARRIYQTLEHPFLRGSRPNPVSLAMRVARRGLPDLARISPFGSMWGALGRYFHDPRLRQLFGRYATYCGSSPFMAPATLMLVAHVEQDGVWLIEGGMHRLAVALEQLATRRGAVFRYGTPVRKIRLKDSRACGVELENGEILDGDAIIFNGDSAALPAGLLGPDARGAYAQASSARRSLSAVTWNVVAPARGFPLLRHNVFFSGDYRAEFQQLFSQSRLPEAPTVYICAQDRRGADGPEPRGPERLLCLVNAPATGDAQAGRGGLSEAQLARCEDSAFSLLERCGLRLSRDPGCSLRTAPHDFERLFPGTGGALYGQAAHGWRASFARPAARSQVPGLYLAGGSTHPGPGVPMAALSGRQAAASVLADLAARGDSLRRGRP